MLCFVKPNYATKCKTRWNRNHLTIGRLWNPPVGVFSMDAHERNAPEDQPTDPFLHPGPLANTVSTSAAWTAVLAAEGLAATASADAAKTDIGTQELGNVSLASLNLRHVVFASDGNYEYFLQTFPPAVDGSQIAAWNAAWMGDRYGCPYFSRWRL